MFLTKEKSEKLIALIEKSIPTMKAQSNLPYSNSELVNHIEIYELALKALMADAVGRVDEFYCTWFTNGVNKKPLPGSIIYTASPVNVIDFPPIDDMPYSGSKEYDDGYKDGAADIIESIKKLNNIEG